MCYILYYYGGARVQNMPEGLYGDFEWAKDIKSVQRSPLCNIGVIPIAYSEQTRAIEAFPSPCLIVFKLQAFIGSR